MESMVLNYTGLIIYILLLTISSISSLDGHNVCIKTKNSIITSTGRIPMSQSSRCWNGSECITTVGFKTMIKTMLSRDFVQVEDCCPGFSRDSSGRKCLRLCNNNISCPNGICPVNDVCVTKTREVCEHDNYCEIHCDCTNYGIYSNDIHACICKSGWNGRCCEKPCNARDGCGVALEDSSYSNWLIALIIGLVAVVIISIITLLSFHLKKKLKKLENIISIQSAYPDSHHFNNPVYGVAYEKDNLCKTITFTNNMKNTNIDTSKLSLNVEDNSKKGMHNACYDIPSNLKSQAKRESYPEENHYEEMDESRQDETYDSLNFHRPTNSVSSYYQGVGNNVTKNF